MPMGKIISNDYLISFNHSLKYNNWPYYLEIWNIMSTFTAVFEKIWQDKNIPYR